MKQKQNEPELPLPREDSPLRALMLQRMQELNWKPNDLARAYGQLKEQHEDVDPLRYRTTVMQVLKNPDTSQFKTVQLCLKAMGISLQCVAMRAEIYEL